MARWIVSGRAPAARGATTGLLAVAVSTLVSACDRASRPPLATPLFVDRTAGSGVDFVHHHCGSGRKYLVEINAGGVALLDYDLDGDLDLHFCQGAPLPGYAGHDDLRDRLYRNDGGFRFTDVTAAANASDDRYTFSAAAPDFDGDGDPDLYHCNYQGNRWLRNDGGRFVDATQEIGGEGGRWSTVAAFADFDRDDDLDCYVVNYVDFSFEHPPCGDLRRGPEYLSYCHPDEFAAADDQLYRNDCGRFVDATEAAGMSHSGGAGLGAAISDYDDDGDVDLFVADDSNPNLLWRNEGGLKFSQVADDANVAVNGAGSSTAGMGTDWGDVDRDGDFDLIVANLAMEVNTLYQNDGHGHFDDRSTASGLGPPSLLQVGFGCEFFDADLDGDLDCMVANGHILDNVQLYEPSQTFRQPPHFYVNDGAGRFEQVGEKAGPFFAGRYVGRGLAIGDLDDDGDQDVVFCQNDGPPFLLENTTIRADRSGDPSNRPPSWIGFKLVGRGKNPQAIGARVTIDTGAPSQQPSRQPPQQPLRQMEEVRGTSSYAAFHDLRLVFGLGRSERVERATIRWPDGRTTVHERPAACTYNVVREE